MAALGAKQRRSEQLRAAAQARGLDARPAGVNRWLVYRLADGVYVGLVAYQAKRRSYAVSAPRTEARDYSTPEDAAWRLARLDEELNPPPSGTGHDHNERGEA
jgi:hypothetical protein